MQDPDPKCRHFGILWHFMAFYGILWHFGIFAKKSNKKSNPIFPILSDFFPIFTLFPTFRLSDSTTLMKTSATTGDDRVIKVTTTISTIMIQTDSKRSSPWVLQKSKTSFKCCKYLTKLLLPQ